MVAEQKDIVVNMISLTFLRKVGGRKKYLFESEEEALRYAREKGWRVNGTN
jgi:hypothetical protein